MHRFCYYQPMDRNIFDRMCKLARIELTEQEQANFEPKFEKLLGFVDVIQKYEPSGKTQPMTLVESLILRPDLPRAFEWPEGQKQHFQVPQIIDFEGEGE